MFYNALEYILQPVRDRKIGYVKSDKTLTNEDNVCCPKSPTLDNITLLVKDETIQSPYLKLNFITFAQT
ncbi:MAG: hypothetical protein IPJ13_05965 [Saprospiraceae bacterium]|nr:hypothetical protein [Saprospiraceae bacterium]